MTSHAGFETAAAALTFILAGKATVTLTSAASGKHFTFKVTKSKDGGAYFVGTLSGPDNNADYQYVGFIPNRGTAPHLTAGNKGKPDAPSFKAFAWALKHLVAGNLPDQLTIQHEGRCCACNRMLTHPDSIASV